MVRDEIGERIGERMTRIGERIGERIADLEHLRCDPFITSTF